MRRHASLLGTAVLVVGALGLLAGCTVTTGPEETITRAEEDPAPPAVTAPDPDATSPAPTVPPDDPIRPGRDCTDGQRTELTAAVDGQLDAIAARDWEQALGFATDDFRADIGPDRFRDIILDDFPVVADARARDIGRCLVDDRQATLVVTVEDRDGTRQPLLYLFEHDGERWSIGGALPPVGNDGGDDASTIDA